MKMVIIMNSCSCCKTDTFGLIHRIELYWKNRRDEPRIHTVCDQCFDKVQEMLQRCVS